MTILQSSQCDTFSGVKYTAGISAGEMSVYPNPNDGSFTFILTSGTKEQVRIIVTNVVGEKVKEFTTATNKTTAIKLDQPAGVYFLSAFTGHASYVVKVVVTQ